MKLAAVALILSALLTSCSSQPSSSPVPAPPSPSSTMPAPGAVLPSSELTEEQAALYADARAYLSHAEELQQESSGPGSSVTELQLADTYEVATEAYFRQEEKGFFYALTTATGATVIYADGGYSLLIEDTRPAPEGELSSAAFQKDMERLQSAFEAYYEEHGEWPALSSFFSEYSLGENSFDGGGEGETIELSPRWLYLGFTSSEEAWTFTFSDPATRERAVGTPEGLRVFRPFELAPW